MFLARAVSLENIFRNKSNILVRLALIMDGSNETNLTCETREGTAFLILKYRKIFGTSFQCLHLHII